MPARKRPTPEDTITARRVLLDGLARDLDIFELVSELAPLHPQDNTFPGEVLLRAAADALDWCGASRAEPLSLEGLRERFLPERAFRGGKSLSGSRCRGRDNAAVLGDPVDDAIGAVPGAVTASERPGQRLAGTW
jgi:hypothetical protein